MSDLEDFVNDPVVSDDGCCVHCGGEFGKHHDCPQVKARAELARLRKMEELVLAYRYSHLQCSCDICKAADAVLPAE